MQCLTLASFSSSGARSRWGQGGNGLLLLRVVGLCCLYSCCLRSHPAAPLHVCTFGKVLSKFTFPEQLDQYSTQVEEVADTEVIN